MSEGSRPTLHVAAGREAIHQQSAAIEACESFTVEAAGVEAENAAMMREAEAAQAQGDMTRDDLDELRAFQANGDS